MRAISLWQPWASLVALDAKRIETRHWPVPTTLVGQRIAIHAAKTKAHLHICDEPPFDLYIPKASLLPLGAIVATATLAQCTAITEDLAGRIAAGRPHEYAFGLYIPGRFAWVLRDVEPLPAAVPFRGAQGFFNVPDHFLPGRAAA
jgi:activating signal cointegrator 1